MADPPCGDRDRETLLPNSPAENFETTPGPERNEQRWVDSAVLDDLEIQMGSRDIVLRFAGDYARLWTQRKLALMSALERQDHEAALDAVISLKNSSIMVGGLRLARLAEELEAAIRVGEGRDGWHELLEAVSQQGQTTVTELQHSYLREGPAGGQLSTGASGALS